MYWLLGRKSKLSKSNKIIIRKAILKPIWTYGIQLWGIASSPNIEILEHLQSKALRMIVEATWCVSNTIIGSDLGSPTVTEEIRRYSSQYSARHSARPNDLSMNFKVQPYEKAIAKTTAKRCADQITTEIIVLYIYIYIYICIYI
jgi:hypothetical protein